MRGCLKRVYRRDAPHSSSARIGTTGFHTWLEGKYAALAASAFDTFSCHKFDVCF